MFTIPRYLINVLTTCVCVGEVYSCIYSDELKHSDHRPNMLLVSRMLPKQ